MRTITNHYRDSHVLNLGSAGERGPYLVTQTGASPNDPLAKERMFVLRPDGRWVDFNAYVCQDKPEVMEAFGKLMGRPQILDLPVNEAGLNAWIERQKSGNPLEAAHEWAVGYRERHRKKRRDHSKSTLWARILPQRKRLRKI